MGDNGTKLRIGISPCPNDTYLFHGILRGIISDPQLDLSIELLDIEALNRAAASKALDICKVSFHAALYLTEEWEILPVGAAVGRGVGPIVVAKDNGSVDWNRASVALPGELTTAALLTKIFHPEVNQISYELFSDISKKVVRGEVDLGVLIHEGRFSYHRDGLVLVEDLGARWEEATGEGLPLGGLIVQKKIERDVVERFIELVQRSYRYSMEHKEEVQETMKYYAQEQDAEMVWKHVELYVNEDTYSLSESAWRSLRVLSEMAGRAGLIKRVV